MIIAWAFFIVGSLSFIILSYDVLVRENNKATTAVWYWFTIAVCSAQYIWG